MSLLAILKTREFRWAAAGWTFFIAENAVLSEHRTWLIETLGGDEPYHYAYGTCSTLATASIGYAYYLLKKNATISKPISLPSKIGSITFMTVGLIMASQALPNLQVPVSSDLKVRCPFDFATSNDTDKVVGLERITRHAGLWSLAFVGLGNACLAPTIPLTTWWLGPAAVAWLGGAHTDSRFQRNLGGSMDPHRASQTSNIPFAAMLSGRQGPPATAFAELMQEIKPINAAVAAGVATMWVMSRGRVKPAYV
jgi:uncharacterized membrane protein